MTPIESTFAIAVDTRLDWEALGRILATGHSRVPVYSGDSKNLIGLLLVKSLITVRAEDEMPVSAVPIRKLPRVPADTPLYDMLNEFQKGQSHMAAVVSSADKGFETGDDDGKTVSVGDFHNHVADDRMKVASEYTSKEEYPDAAKGCHECKVTISSEDSQTFSNLGMPQLGNEAARQPCRNIEGQVIGIITLEDVFEELIQEEIVDETDMYVDVHKRIRVTNGASPLVHRNGAVGQNGCSLPSNQRHGNISRSTKTGKKSPGKASSKPINLTSLKPVYNLTAPLLDKA